MSGALFVSDMPQFVMAIWNEIDVLSFSDEGIASKIVIFLDKLNVPTPDPIIMTRSVFVKDGSMEFPGIHFLHCSVPCRVLLEEQKEMFLQCAGINYDEEGRCKFDFTHFCPQGSVDLPRI